MVTTLPESGCRGDKSNGVSDLDAYFGDLSLYYALQDGRRYL